jgi:hypothetical protein
MRRCVMIVAGAFAPFVALALGFSVAGCPLVAFPIPADDPELDAGSDATIDVATDVATDAPPPECAAPADCDDGNACTLDSCVDGACTSTLAPAGTACADADLCNGAEACNGLGQCASGAPVVVDDGDPCTADGCDAATGLPTHTKLAACGWAPTAATGAPAPRQRHTAVWTGSKMIVWGGNVTGAPSVTATGGLYDPATDTWTPTSSINAPPPRHSHRAVWTGSKMIVWGGFGTTTYENTGGIYDPATDTWIAMNTVGAPSGRTEHAMVWTDKLLVVSGGFNGNGIIGGGSFDPATNTWTTLPLAGAAGPRLSHSAVWSGVRAIFWGGNDLSDWHKDGVQLTPGAPGVWSNDTDLVGAPGPREGHTALWSGATMLIWGGWNGGPYLDDGGAFDPATDANGSWSTISTTGAPSARTEHTAVWTSSAMVVWGGCGGDACVTVLGDGGVWTPGAGGGAWKPVAPVATITPRQRHTAVWTGVEMIVWGGKAKSGITASGARFAP